LYVVFFLFYFLLPGFLSCSGEHLIDLLATLIFLWIL